jgi:hypothetical protein
MAGGLVKVPLTLMKKEAVIAIIGGFILGLIITFGIVTAQKSIKEKSAPPTIVPTVIPLPTVPSISLFINSPQNNELVKEKVTMVSGSTDPNSMVSIISTTDRNSAVADPQGNFSFPIELISGVNLITVASYNPQGISIEKNLKVIYLKNTAPTPTP